MNRTEKNLLLQLLAEMAQGETVDYVVQGMRDSLGADAPTAESIRGICCSQITPTAWMSSSGR